MSASEPEQAQPVHGERRMALQKRESEAMDTLLKETLKNIAENTPYMKMLGMELLELSEGYAKGRMKMEEKIGNPYGGAHGGALYSLADTISGVAACTYGVKVCTVSGCMNYFLPGVGTEYIYCEAKVVRQGKHLAVYNVEIMDDGGNLIQNGTFTFYVMESVQFEASSPGTEDKVQ